MRVVHINYDGSGWGGASIAMLRIHHAMRRDGVDSQIVCRAEPRDEFAHQLPISIMTRTKIFLARVAMKIVCGHVYRSCLVDTGMADYVNAMHPDKVVLHWLHIDAIGMDEISKIKAPIDWWLHDLWPMSGINPYPETNWFKKGPPRENFVSRHVWRRKCDAVRKIGDRLTVVGPSEWVCNEARQSVVFRTVKVRHEPYPMDVQFVNEARNLDVKKDNVDKFVVLFGAVGGTRNPIKGFDRLLDAAKLLPCRLKNRLWIYVFGENHADELRDGIRIHYLGELDTPRKLVEAYKSADVFAFPSYSETWGQVKSEAMLCGCPVVAFDESACAEGIRHGVDGWIASSGDIREFAVGLSKFSGIAS